MTSMDREFLAPESLESARSALAKATTLPANAFTSPGLYEIETERVLASSWLCAGRLDQVPNVGDYRCVDLLGDKLVMVRSQDEIVRVFSRVCRHRAAEVACGHGNTKSFQCPYHAWTYSLDGSLRGAPFMEQTANFDRRDFGLPEIRTEVWEGWVFVNFDREAEALGPQLAPLSQLLAPYRLSEMVAVETATYESPFNWKVLTDNFMEAYHHIAIHRDTLEPIYPAKESYTPENEGPYSVLMMPTASKPRSQSRDFGFTDPLIAATVFPFHLFAPNEDSLTWYQIQPERHDHFKLRIYSCFPPEMIEDPDRASEIEGMQEVVRVIHHQDIEACETVWAGLNSRSFDVGPLCSLEEPIWQFNQWWIEKMTRS